MCALNALRAQTHLGLSAVRWSGWFPPGDPPVRGAVEPRAEGLLSDTSEGDTNASAATTPARCDCLAGVLHAL